MLPLLRRVQDGLEHDTTTLREKLADDLGLSEDDRRETIPSGTIKFVDRVSWARIYLIQAKLIEAPRWGKIKITKIGLQALMNSAGGFDYRHYLKLAKKQNPGSTTESDEFTPTTTGPDQTPIERIDALMTTLREGLIEELLTKIKSCSPAFFERLVLDLLVAMGYGGSMDDANHVGRIRDGGIDGTIKEDRLGLEYIYVQAKRWEGNVSRPTVQGFAGSLDAVHARKGVIITTSDYTADAKEYVTRIEKKIVLINGYDLAGYMIDFGIGVSEENRYVVKKIDMDYFEES